MENGYWEGNNITNKYHGYTNYHVCLTEASLEQTNQITNIEVCGQSTKIDLKN